MDYYFKIADTCSIHKIAGYDQSYIVDNTNGCWCVFDNEFSDFISAFIGNSVSSVDLHLNHTHFALLKSLFMQGILRINEESYFTEKETKETNNRLTIIVNTTNRCNLRCDYCYAYSDSPHRLSFSPVSIEEDIKKIAGNNTKQEILVVFHGGEPLLCWDRIVEMVQKLSDTFDDISFSIQTNGTLINKQIVDFVKTHNIRIGVSLDGSDKQTNIHRFGEDNNDYLNTVSRNIDLLTHNGVKFGILSVVTNENYKELLNSMSFFVEKGVRGFGYNYILSKGRSSDKNPAVPVSELVDVYTKIACYINDYNARHDPKDYISERTVSVLVYSLAHKPLGACYSSPCMAGDGHFALDVNGDVYPCDEFVGESEFCIGNIRNEDFSIDNKRDIIARFRCRSIDSLEKCRQCPLNRLCPFKCPSDSYYRTGELFQPHSMCEFTRFVLPRYMYLLQNSIIRPEYFVFH